LSGEFRYKQVIAVRADLKMGRGKLAAQVAHAAVASARECERGHPDWFRGWWEEGQAKVVVKVQSETDLLELSRQARELGLPAALVVDKGLTQLPANTTTCLGIGPCPVNLVDRVTGALKLL
jgi:PTH2 family peptidyl-tRNA hydrolase